MNHVGGDACDEGYCTCGTCSECVDRSINHAEEMERESTLERDLGLAIVRYATSVKRKISPAEFVKSILQCGRTSAYKFCNEHMVKDGWKSTHITPPPVEKILLACEDLGDQTEAMMFDGDRWMRIGRRARVVVSYIPKWWKDVNA